MTEKELDEAKLWNIRLQSHKRKHGTYKVSADSPIQALQLGLSRHKLTHGTESGGVFIHSIEPHKPKPKTKKVKVKKKKHKKKKLKEETTLPHPYKTLAHVAYETLRDSRLLSRPPLVARPDGPRPDPAATMYYRQARFKQVIDEGKSSSRIGWIPNLARPAKNPDHRTDDIANWEPVKERPVVGPSPAAKEAMKRFWRKHKAGPKEPRLEESKPIKRPKEGHNLRVGFNTDKRVRISEHPSLPRIGRWQPHPTIPNAHTIIPKKPIPLGHVRDRIEPLGYIRSDPPKDRTGRDEFWKNASGTGAIHIRKRGHAATGIVGYVKEEESLHETDAPVGLPRHPRFPNGRVHVSVPNTSMPDGRGGFYHQVTTSPEHAGRYPRHIPSATIPVIQRQVGRGVVVGVPLKPGFSNNPGGNPRRSMKEDAVSSAQGPRSPRTRMYRNPDGSTRFDTQGKAPPRRKIRLSGNDPGDTSGT